MNSSTPHTVKKNATIADTISAMRTVALQGRKDLTVRGLVEEICAGVSQGDYAGEVLAIYYWVCRNIRYMRDPSGVELVKTPTRVLSTRAGDCDDIATLLAAMLLSSGNTVNFAIASFRAGRPVFSHVFVEVVTPHGLITIDPVGNRVTRKMLRDMKHKQAFPVGHGAMDAGVGGGCRCVGGKCLCGLGALEGARHRSQGGQGVYSVYDYRRGVYEYFQGASDGPVATGQFRRPRGGARGFGAPPEDFAESLPITAAKIGEGTAAKGTIATRTGGIAAPAWLGYLALGVAAGYVGARIVRSKR